MKRSKTDWSLKAKILSKELHAELTLDDRSWHQFKSDHNRRAAELVSGGLVQLINGGNTSEIEAQLEQSLRWLKKEIADPGCPRSSL